MKKKTKTLFEGLKKTVREESRTVMDDELSEKNISATIPDESIPASVNDAAKYEGAYALGTVLLDTYRVISNPINGGMGSVWRVHHEKWEKDLAMKRPKPEFFTNEAQKNMFANECSAWINLGLHPNIVSCYYVRNIDGVPSIFSEWMDAGSLENAIEDESLYSGSESEVQARIIDIAIQFARGLNYAHGSGLIHQDVKPDNLLLTREGEAKVADFGIARARAALTEHELSDSADRGTVFTKSGAYTREYCSMEQMNGLMLTRRTDIYSWAVSVLEMYFGACAWDNGIVAAAGADMYLDRARVKPTESMRALLKHCLKERQEDRPHDFIEIDAVLSDIYKEVTGGIYPRAVSKAASDTANSLNNRALSYLDLSNVYEAEKAFERALEKESYSISATYNYGLLLWRQGRITDIEMLRRTANMRDNAPNDADVLWMSAQVCIERGDFCGAAMYLEKAGRIDEANAIRHAPGGIERTSEINVYGAAAALSFDGSTLLDGASKECHTGARLVYCADGKTLVSFASAAGEQDVFAYLFRDNRRALTMDSFGAIRIFDAVSGKLMLQFNEPTDMNVENLRCCISENERCLIASVPGEVVQYGIWEISTGRCIKTVTIPYPLGIIAYLSDTADIVRTVHISIATLPDKAYELDINGETAPRETDPLDDKNFSSDVELRSSTMRVWLPKNRGYYMRETDPLKEVVLEQKQTGMILHTTARDTFTGSSAGCVSGNGRVFVTRNYTMQHSDQHMRGVIVLPSFDMKAAWYVARVASTAERSQGDAEFSRLIELGSKCAKEHDCAGVMSALNGIRELNVYSDTDEYEAVYKAALEVCEKTGLKDTERRTVALENPVEIAVTGKTVYCADKDAIRVYDVKKRVCTLDVAHEERSRINGIACGGDKVYLALADPSRGIMNDKYVKSYNANTLGYTGMYTNSDVSMAYIDASNDGKVISGGGRMGCVCMWRPNKTKPYALSREGHTTTISCIAVSFDGSTVISGDTYGTIVVWDAKNGKIRRTLRETGYYAKSLALSANGERAYTGCMLQNELCCYDTFTGSLLYSLPVHTNGIGALALTSDERYVFASTMGRSLFTNPGDNLIRVFDTSTHECVCMLECPNMMRQLFVTDNDTRLVGLDADNKQLYIWKLEWNLKVK